MSGAFILVRDNHINREVDSAFNERPIELFFKEFEVFTGFVEVWTLRVLPNHQCLFLVQNLRVMY